MQLDTRNRSFEGPENNGLSGPFQNDRLEAQLATCQVNEANDELRILSRAVDQSPISVVITDLDGTIQYVNPKFSEVTGYSPDEVVGENPRVLKSGKQSKAFYASLWSTILAGNVWKGELHNCRKDGTEFWESAAIAPVIDSEGRISHFVAMKEDITERKLAEAELSSTRMAVEKANEELREVNQQLEEAVARANSMAAEAEMASAAKSEFLANMSHEIRTPMNGILGMTNLVLDTELSLDQQEFISTIKNSGEALLTIINDILDYSKIEAKKLELESIGFDLRELMEDISDILAVKAFEKDLEFVNMISPRVWTQVEGDPGRVRQVLNNLAGNAIKFTDQGHVIIRVRQASETASQVILQFEVIDSGIGIRKDKIDNLFESFTQVDASTTRKYGGTGLGLAISKQLVELMGGEIGVESACGKGTTFWFSIPFLKGGERNAGDEPDRPASESIRILAVDDSAASGEVLSEYLTSWGFDAVVLSDPREVLPRLESALEDEKPFDLVITDFQMPHTDGKTLASTIAGHPNLRRTPVIMLVSIGRVKQELIRELPGVNHFVTKPIKGSRLTQCLKSVLDTEQTCPLPGMDSAAGPPEKTDVPRWVGLRVLLAEDNPTNQKVAQHILARAGVDVDVVGNGRLAVNAVRTGPYDLVLMDVQMPEMDGLKATRQIRRREASENKEMRGSDQSEPGKPGRIPIIALTANAMVEDRRICLEAGMDDYLAKPIDPQQLFEILEKHVKAGNPGDTGDGVGDADTGGTSPPPDPAAILDVEAALKRAMGDSEFLKEMIALYLEETPGQIDDIERALDQSDSAGAAKLAHALKGASASLGAVAMADAAFSIEKSGKARDPVGARAATDRLRKEMERFRHVAESPKSLLERTS